MGLRGQDASKDPDPAATSNDKTSFGQSKRIFGIVPNYRTDVLPNPFKPITAKQKFVIASQDSFDRGTVILAAAFAGQGQLSNSNRAFGQGVEGYAKYFAASYTDFVVGDFMTEAIYPAMLHQDPRYFSKLKGGVWSRLGYAAGQILVTHGDNGRTQFNFSEVLGNSTAVAISQAYYQNNRDASDAAIRLATQLGVDAAANILKEFWPDIQHKMHHHGGNNK